MDAPTRYALAVASFLAYWSGGAFGQTGLQLTQATKGESVYSDKSLIIMCANDRHVIWCGSYIRGVVETWHIKDAVGPDQYGNGGYLTFCSRILQVSSDEWTSIIRRNLRSVEPGFASVEV